MTNSPRPMGPSVPGWLVVRRDGAIVVADRAFADLVGVPDAGALVGSTWTSLVSPTDAWPLAEAREAEAARVPWSGTVTLVTACGDERVNLELFPAGPAAGDLTTIRATVAPPVSAPSPAALAASTPSDVEILLTATESGDEAADASAAGRSVLQAIRVGLAFDWGVVLRFVDDGAEVVATYPAGMAGMERGVRWAPLDDAERIIRESGEPALDGEMARRFHERSPLARLPAFGMRSRLQIPVFAADAVRGCVSLYATEPRAFAPLDGIRLERFIRPLRPHLAVAATQPPLTAPGAQRTETPIPPDLPHPPFSPSDEIVAPPASPTTPPAPVEAPSPAERARWEAGPRDRAEIVERRLGALGEMVSGVAHELNNPLTAILGYAQILPSLEGRDRDQALATIEQEALRASRIVRNLLAFARQHRTSVQPVDVEAVLRRVIDVRRQSLSGDHVTVESHFAGLPPVTADEYQLEQVFLNLINNAYQAMLPQGGTLTLTTEVQNGTVRVIVADTGPGVPEEVADRIFEPFFTTRDVGAGAGLGLAIVYGIVAEHGGHVWVERSPAGGAQFVVELPRAAEPIPDATPAAETPAAETGAPATAPADRRRILVVDDELPIRALTNEILSAAGYVVDTAAGGDEALRQLETSDYDAVIADMRLPGFAGDSLYRIITGRWPRLRGRVMFVTGDPEADHDAELLDADGSRHLEKPFDTQTLLRAVRELLEDAAS